MRRRWCFASGVLATALALAGCAPSSLASRRTAADPDQRLDEILQAYDSNRAAESGCLDDFEAGHAVVDCGRLRRQVEALALEHPRHVRILLVDAQLAYVAREPVRAQQLLDQVLALDPAQGDAAALRARIALGEGNLRFASVLVARSIRLSPAHAELREVQAATDYLAGRFDDARRALDAAARLGAPAWRVAYHRGLLAEAEGDSTLARQCYEEALTDRPDWAPAAARLAGLDEPAPSVP